MCILMDISVLFHSVNFIFSLVGCSSFDNFFKESHILFSKQLFHKEREAIKKSFVLPPTVLKTYWTMTSKPRYVSNLDFCMPLHAYSRLKVFCLSYIETRAEIKCIGSGHYCRTKICLYAQSGHAMYHALQEKGIFVFLFLIWQCSWSRRKQN